MNGPRRGNGNWKSGGRGFYIGGLPYMISAKFSYFWTPSPLVTYRNQLILLLLSAFWGPPLPHPDVIYGSPLTKRTD